MKKLNLICASVAVLCAGAAQAGNLSAVNTKFATEIFGTATTAATSVLPGAATYTITTTNGIVVNPLGKIYVTVRLTNGKFVAAPAVGTLTGTALTIVGSLGTVSTSYLSADKSTAVFEVTYTNGVTLGLGSTFVFTPAAAIDNVKDSLATAGGTVSATMSMSGIATVTAPDATAAQAADVDGPAVTAVIATSVKGVSTAFSVPAGLATKVNLASTPVPGSNYINGVATAAYVKLGEVTITRPATAPKQANGVALFDLDNAFDTGATVAVTVTPDAGKSFPVGGRVYLSANDCATNPGGIAQTAVLNSTTAAAAVTVNVLAADLVALGAGDTTFTRSICQTDAAGDAIGLITPSLSAAVTYATALTNYKTDSASGTGYALTYNGSQVDVNAYWPGSLKAAAGYAGYVRVINTGALAAKITAAHFNLDGSLGTAHVLNLPAPFNVTNELPSGAQVILSTETIDALLGAAPSGYKAGRLRVTAPTNSMKVQSFIQQGTNAPQETSGAQQ